MNPNRRPIRLSSKNYLGSGAYFVTICCYQRSPLILDLGPFIVKELIASAARQQFHLIAYYAMPDHIHFLVHGKAKSANLIKFVSAFKQKTAYRCQKDHGRKLWQPRYFEHILRTAEDFEPIALYIWNNPVRQKLCPTPADYPLSGSLTLGWKSHCASRCNWRPPWREKSNS